MDLPPEPVELPIWRGRRGLINTVICGALGLACGVGLAELAERRVVVPECTAYGERHGMRYTDYRVYTSGLHGSGVCSFKTGRGGVEDVSLEEATSWFTDFYLGIAFKLELTVPLFIVLFAVLRSLPHLRKARA